MQNSLDNDPMGFDSPEAAAQDAFVDELESLDTAATLRKAARGEPLSSAEAQLLHALASDVEQGHMVRTPF